MLYWRYAMMHCSRMLCGNKTFTTSRLTVSQNFHFINDKMIKWYVSSQRWFWLHSIQLKHDQNETHQNKWSRITKLSLIKFENSIEFDDSNFDTINAEREKKCCRQRRFNWTSVDGSLENHFHWTQTLGLSNSSVRRLSVQNEERKKK